MKTRFLAALWVLTSMLCAGLAQASLSIVHDPSVIPGRVRDAFENNSNFEILSVPMNVGVRVRLELYNTGGGIISNVQWNVGCPALHDYAIASARAFGEGYITECTPMPLTAGLLDDGPRPGNQPPVLSFYFTETGSCQVTVDADVNGIPQAQASITFDVIRHPKAETFYVTGGGQSATPDEDRADLLGEHSYWHDSIEDQAVTGENADEFLRFHRGFIQKFNCWRGIFGYSCVQPYVSGPCTCTNPCNRSTCSSCTVPTDPGVDHFGAACSSPDCSTPDGTGDGIAATPRDTCDYDDIPLLPELFKIGGGLATNFPGPTGAHDLAFEMAYTGGNYHETLHTTLCHSGDFFFPERSPADPIFWRVHFTLTRLYELWRLLKLNGTSLVVNATSPAGAVVYLPDPSSNDYQLGCSNGVPDPCTPPSGSLFPIGTTPVTCNAVDVDATVPAQTVAFDVTVQQALPPADVFLEDTPYDVTAPLDTGAEPNTSGLDMWKSRAIWVRTQSVTPGPTNTFAHHQNPEVGQTNYVYATLTNGGPNAPAQATAGSLRLYYADASTGLSWPSHFVQFALLRNISVPQSGTYTAEAPWDPPGEGHFCLIAVWESDHDFMTFPLGSSLDPNVRNNNNIAWRNVNIVNLLPTDSKKTEFIVRNTSTTNATVDLGITALVGQTGTFLSRGGILIDLGPTLFGKWQAAGGFGTGVQTIPNTTVAKVLQPLSEILGIPMDPGEEHTVSIAFQTFVSNLAGAPPGGHFNVDVSEVVNSVAVGGIAYDIYVGPAVPTLSHWSLIALAVLLFRAGAMEIRRLRPRSTPTAAPDAR